MKNLGLIAGNGDFPLLVAKGAKQSGVKQIVVAAILGETDESIEVLADVVVWVEVGQLSQMIHFFKKNGCDSIVMAGQITPLKLYSKLKLDLRMAKLMSSVKFRGAAPLLGTIAEELAKDGLNIIDSTTFVKDHLADKGCMTEKKPNPAQLKEIEKGRQLAKSIADLDIGQTLVMKEGSVVAVEAIEGTNETIKRAGLLAGAGIIVLKVSKTKQDKRFDIPVIGIETIKVLHEAGAAILAVDHDGAIMLNKPDVIRLSNELGIILFGM
ncbi:MAG: UDP-2,3-diacylglucosamine diphosphatase LpxI [Candidatus Aureabacteria bacterium]|nr:UDP-2,3-diacylglucosamine diphosphatase LpxI [Candidatus Auribacterota bacterium]